MDVLGRVARSGPVGTSTEAQVPSPSPRKLREATRRSSACVPSRRLVREDDQGNYVYADGDHAPDGDHTDAGAKRNGLGGASASYDPGKPGVPYTCTQIHVG